MVLAGGEVLGQIRRWDDGTLLTTQSAQPYANLEGMLLDYADLAGANLYCAELRGSSLNYSHLMSANLCGADLDSAQPGGADLSGADLRGDVFYKAVLTGASPPLRRRSSTASR